MMIFCYTEYRLVYLLYLHRISINDHAATYSFLWCAYFCHKVHLESFVAMYNTNKYIYAEAEK